MSQEFDRYSGDYEELLRDPVRDRFLGGNSGFFHARKRDLVREYFKDRRRDTRALRYLDIGCGKGELATLLRDDFAEVFGCDPSTGMLEAATGIQTRVQSDPEKIPFDDGQFDFVTAVCVYHHVPPASRLNLTREIRRVLKPAGTLCVIEHNPWNPATRLIVSRTPVDVDAILLYPSETRRLLAGTDLVVEKSQFFLYLPMRIYARIGGVETALSRIPLGGQYAVFGSRTA